MVADARGVILPEDDATARRRNQWLRVIRRIGYYLLVLVVCAVVFSPIYWMIVSSLKTSAELLLPERREDLTAEDFAGCAWTRCGGRDGVSYGAVAATDGSTVIPEVRRLVFANASQLLPYRGRGVLRMSLDDGATWPVARTFNPKHYVYQCMTQLPDGTLGLLWERETQGLYFTRLPREWFPRV